jgi:hypothetical protein
LRGVQLYEGIGTGEAVEDIRMIYANNKANGNFIGIF